MEALFDVRIGFIDQVSGQAPSYSTKAEDCLHQAFTAVKIIAVKSCDSSWGPAAEEWNHHLDLWGFRADFNTDSAIAATTADAVARTFIDANLNYFNYYYTRMVALSWLHYWIGFASKSLTSPWDPGNSNLTVEVHSHRFLDHLPSFTCPKEGLVFYSVTAMKPLESKG